MCSLTAFPNNQLKSTNGQHHVDRRKCGDIYVSLNIESLTLHCLFCGFDDEKLDIFLSHLRSEHLSLLAIDTLYLGTEKNDIEVKEELLEEDETQTQNDTKKTTVNTEPDPLMAEENSVVVSNDQVETKVS